MKRNPSERLRLPKGYTHKRMPVDAGFGFVSEDIKGENDPENPDNEAPNDPET